MQRYSIDGRRDGRINIVVGEVYKVVSSSDPCGTLIPRHRSSCAMLLRPYIASQAVMREELQSSDFINWNSPL